MFDYCALTCIAIVISNADCHSNGGQSDHGVALLISLVTGGYHSSTSYKWSKDGSYLADEIFPIIYVCTKGMYTCTCTFGSVEVKTTFKVHGKI